jgi:signal transduction histidine kinase
MRRLYTRIYLHFVGVLLVVGLATGAVFATGFRTTFIRGTAERMARHAAAMVAARFDDPEATRELVEHFSTELDVDVTVRDLDGRVRAVGGVELPPLDAHDAVAIRSGPVLVWRRQTPYAAVAIRRQGEIVGVLSASPMRRMHPPSLLRPISHAAVFLLVVAVATGPLARRISRPVERLTEATRRFGAGDLRHRVDLEQRPGGGRHRRGRGRADELAELTRAWNEMAERIERLVEGQKELLANVSHELRSPLARIRVALELVPRGSDADARLRDIEADLGELDRLIGDVLTAARLDARGLPLHLGEVDVRTLLEQVAQRGPHDPVVEGRAVEVEPGPPITVQADGVLLKRALWNLVENAAKYGAPPIVLGARQLGDWVSLEVRDQGPGIPPADRERVFAPFWRADRAHTPGAAGESARGVGLGLTLARRIAEVHGGTIAIHPARVEGGVEHGCAVVIELPVHPVDGSDYKTSPPAQA